MGNRLVVKIDTFNYNQYCHSTCTLQYHLLDPPIMGWGDPEENPKVYCLFYQNISSDFALQWKSVPIFISFPKCACEDQCQNAKGVKSVKHSSQP